ncbi:MAG TPA: putative glycoside hydrolase [Gemmatimonadaceae bacterium]
MRASARPLVAPLLALALAACTAGQADRPADVGMPDSSAVAPAPDSGSAGHDSAPASPAGDTVPAAPAVRGTMPSPLPGDAPVVRALYVNRFAAQSTRKMAKLIGFADSTEVNALVIDMKDEFGLNYASEDATVARNAGSHGRVRNLRALLDTLKAHDILPIARLVVFKDSVAARMNPSEVIRKADGSPWRDKEGLTWVNPYSPVIREYNLKVAEELVRLGFGEIQWDYIRFPEPYASLPKQVFPNSGGVSKPQALADFLRQAQARLHPLGVRSTADIFGLVTTVKGALEVGQEWEVLAPVADVLLPMVYPSHYPRGAFGIARPNAEPYQVVKTAIARAHERDAALGITGEHVRPYLQAFSLGQPPYGAEEVRQQIRAVYDAGYQGWVLWHPGSTYDAFIPALEKN